MKKVNKHKKYELVINKSVVQWILAELHSFEFKDYNRQKEKHIPDWG